MSPTSGSKTNKLYGLLERRNQMSLSAAAALDVEFGNQFDEVVRQEELDKLNELSRLANRNATLSVETSEIQNLSIKKVFDQLLESVIGMLNDLTAGKPLVDVFLSSDRILYSGLLLVFAGICIWVIDFTR